MQNNLLKFIFLFAIIFSISPLDMNSNLVSVSYMDKFPHNIDKSFNINLHHPNMDHHNLHALLIVTVSCIGEKSQSINLYPGFSPVLNSPRQERSFHIIKMHHHKFNTAMKLKFFRAAQGCLLEIEYSRMGAKNLFDGLKFEKSLLVTNKINLIRKPILNLTITADDGHNGGVSIGRRAHILCTSTDGYPVVPIKLTYSSSLDVLKEFTEAITRNYIEFYVNLRDHLTDVSCESNGASVKKKIVVFHHAHSVEIIPMGTTYFQPHSRLECKSLGNGYPVPKVSWSVVNLNQSSQRLFTINSHGSKTSSFLTINPGVSIKSTWTLNCSSSNIIPPMDRASPFKILKITIGDDPVAAKNATTRAWTVSVVVCVLIVVFVVGLVCMLSRFRCGRSRRRRQSETTGINDHRMALSPIGTPLAPATDDPAISKTVQDEKEVRQSMIVTLPSGRNLARSCQTPTAPLPPHDPKKEHPSSAGDPPVKFFCPDKDSDFMV